MTCNGDPRGADGSTPISCVLDAVPPEQRSAHVALVRQLFGQAIQAHRDLADGYECRFGLEFVEALGRFILNERKCCPFVNFELAVAAQSDYVTLRMTGPEGTKDVLRTELLSNR